MSRHAGAAPGSIADSPSSDLSLTTHAVWLLVAKTVGFALAVALPVLLVRRMTQEEFGLYKQVFFIVGTAMNVLPFGFGMSAFYFLPREGDRQGAIVINILAFYAGVGVLVSALLIAWPQSLVLLFNNPDLAHYAGSLGVLMFLWTIASFLEIVTVAAQDVRATTGFIVVSQMSKTGLLVVAAMVFGTVSALIAAGILQGVLQSAMMLAYLHKRFPGFWRAFDVRLLRTQAGYALPLGSASLILKMQNDLHHYFVSHAFGPAAYAIYAVGVFKMPLVGILRESVGSVILPRINALERQNAQRQIVYLVATAARKLALVYYPFFAFLMVTGPDVIALLFTPQYLDSWPILAISMAVIPFNVIVLEPVTRAQSERYFILRMRLLLFAGLTAVLWFFSRQLGLVGIISAVTATFLVGWGIAAWRMVRLLEMGMQDLRLFADVGRIAVAAGLAGAVTAWMRVLVLTGAAPWLVVTACGVIFAAVYAAIVQRYVMKPGELATLWTEVTRLWLRRAKSEEPTPVEVVVVASSDTGEAGRRDRPGTPAIVAEAIRRRHVNDVT